MSRLRRAALAALLLASAACAAGPGRRARVAVDALVARSDAGEAAVLAERAPRDPWARLAASLVARRVADVPAEAAQLVGLAVGAPDHPLAVIALRRLAELAEESPALARLVEDGLAAPLAAHRFAGLAAYRARVARIAAAEVLGEHERVAALRTENGAVTAWTLAGPFGRRRALDFVEPRPADSGVLPDAAPAPLAGAPRPTRPLPAPDGTVALEGEPAQGEVFYLAADATLARGGRYLVALGTSMSARLQIDGVLVHERRDFAAHLPAVVHVPISLAAGRHRVLVKVARTEDRAAFHLAFAREDGAPSDASWAPAPAGSLAPPAPRPTPGTPVFGARSLAAALAPEAGAPLAALLAGMDAASVDRETAKALLAEAAAALPASATVRLARAIVIASDTTLDEQVARARAEAELREALSRDPGHVAARITLASLLRRTGRLDEADEVLAVVAPPGAALPGRGAALALARARAADARGLVETAEALVAEAIAAGDGCRALELGRDLAGRRRAVQVEDERARALAACRDGRERLAEHLRRRGDLAGAAAALAPVVRARPWALEPAFALAAVHVAAGEPGRAVEALRALRAIWPRSARIEKRLADALELAGDAAGARAARERALLDDGGDLPLRRALALEDGREVLDEWAEDAGSAIRAYEAARRTRTDDTSSAMVLDAAAVEVHPGGALTERTHQVIHVLDPKGVEQFGEVSIPPGAEVLAVRTLKPDGRAVEPERVSKDGKGTISLAGLEPGDYVRFEFVRGVRGDGEGAVAERFFFRAEGSRLFRSTYVVAAPEGLGLEVEAHGMPAPTPVRERGRDVIRGTAADVPALVPEPNQPQPGEILPYLHVGIGEGREAVHRDLADALAGKARSTEEIRAYARRIRAEAGGGAPPAALARAAWARLSRDVLGSGGSFDDASEVLSRGRGGRLFLLQAVLAELGVRARVAFVRPFAADPAPRRFPSRTGWSYPLLRIEAGGAPLWHDPALRMAPLGTIPSSVLGCEALVVPEPGEPLELARTPERAPVEDRRELALRIALRADGGAELGGEDRFHGAMAAAVKGGIERLDATERRQVVEQMLARTFRGLSLSSVEVLGEEDPDAPFTLRWRGTVGALARAANGGLVLDAAIEPARLGARYVQVAARTTPLVIGLPETIEQRIEVVAPEGFRPEPAPAGAADGPFGSFTRSERTDGRTLVREERLALRRGRIAPERYADFAAFAAAVDHLQQRPVAFAGEVPAIAPAGVPGPPTPQP